MSGKKTRFNPLDPENPVFWFELRSPSRAKVEGQSRDEGQIKFKQSRKPSLLRWGVTGFTLVELIVSIVIIGFIAASVANLMVTAANTTVFFTTRTELRQDANYALSRMQREIQTMGMSVSTFHEAAILGASADSLSFLTFVGVALSDFWIRYYFDANTGTLVREKRDLPSGTLINNDILLGNIQAFAFSYVAEDNTEFVPSFTDPYAYPGKYDIRRIVIRCTVGRNGQTLALEAQVNVPKNTNQLGDKFF